VKKLGIMFGLGISLIFFIVNLAQADLVTNPGDIPGPQVVLDFSQFSGVNFSTAPVQVSEVPGYGVTLTGSFWYGDFSYNLGYLMHADPQNGYWSSPQHYVASGEVGSAVGTLLFKFDTVRVEAVGAVVNYDPYYGAPTMAVYDGGFNLLESYNLADYGVSTPGQENAGEFRGIARSTADIRYFSLTGGMEVLTNLTFTDAEPVPLPGAVWLVGTGLLGLVGWRRKLQS